MTINQINFSVIVPTFQRNKLLAQCLNRLSNENQGITDQYEVIVSDDSLLDVAKEMVETEFPWVKWIKGPGKGPAANRNSAVNYALGEWLIFTDDDCLPDSSWLNAYKTAIINYPENQVFEGRTYSDRPKKAFNEISPVNESGGIMPSCNFMIQKKLFLQIKGFDENFKFYFEDMDLYYRIKKTANYPVFVKKASVCHPWRKANSLQFWKNRKFYVDSYWLFITKDEKLLKSHSALFFLKQFVKDLIFDTLLNCYKYRSTGIIYNLAHRVVHLELFLKRIRFSPKRVKEIPEKIKISS